MQVLNNVQHKGHTINIVRDENPSNPRDEDNLGTMICFHKRYALGDNHKFARTKVGEFVDGHNNFRMDEYSGWDELETAIEKVYDGVLLPIYMYDHSGITIATTPFSCPWDSGKIGYIGISKEKIRKEYGWKVITAKRKAQIAEYLVSEVKTYDQFLRGDICGFITHNEYGVETDSCWGFYSEEDAIDHAKACI